MALSLLEQLHYAPDFLTQLQQLRPTGGNSLEVGQYEMS
jgi:hypothetical protein